MAHAVYRMGRLADGSNNITISTPVSGGVSVTKRCPTVLCIDDDANILALRRTLLATAGYEVHVAKNGEIGLEIFRNELPDVVVLDYDMPGMMGDEVARHMRRLRRDVPLLLVTAFPDLPATSTAIFDATIVKGESPTLLLETMTSLLAEHHPFTVGNPSSPESGKVRQRRRAISVGATTCKLPPAFQKPIFRRTISRRTSTRFRVRT